MRRNKASTSRGVQKDSVRVFCLKTSKIRILLGLVHDHLTPMHKAHVPNFQRGTHQKLTMIEDRVGRGDQPVAMKFMLIKLVPAFNP